MGLCLVPDGSGMALAHPCSQGSPDTQSRAHRNAFLALGAKSEEKHWYYGLFSSFLCKSAMADICLLFFVVLEKQRGFGSKIAIRWLDME